MQRNAQQNGQYQAWKINEQMSKAGFRLLGSRMASATYSTLEAQSRFVKAWDAEWNEGVLTAQMPAIRK